MKGLAWIQQESTFWRRSLWEKSGGCLSNNLKLAGDFELWCRFYLYANLYGASSPLGGFRSQYQQRSRNIEEYAREAQLYLDDMRRSLNWQPNAVQNILRNGKVRMIPKLRTPIISRWGYIGKKIVREKSDRPDSYWDIKDYRF